MSKIGKVLRKLADNHEQWEQYGKDVAHLPTKTSLKWKRGRLHINRHVRLGFIESRVIRWKLAWGFAKSDVAAVERSKEAEYQRIYQQVLGIKNDKT